MHRTGLTPAGNALLAVLAASDDTTLFASQLHARHGCAAASFEAAIAELEARGHIVVQRHVPGPHFAGDFRSVSLVCEGRDAADAASAGRAFFDRWLRQSLQHHRCA